MDRVKVSLRVLDTEKDKVGWVHFCYVDYTTLSQFLLVTDSTRSDLIKWVRQWVYKDFNVDLSMSTKAEVYAVKALILDRYHSIFPDLCDKRGMDKHGWTRFWMHEKMRREISLKDGAFDGGKYGKNKPKQG